MKKLLYICLAAAMLLSLTGCDLLPLLGGTDEQDTAAAETETTDTPEVMEATTVPAEAADTASAEPEATDPPSPTLDEAPAETEGWEDAYLTFLDDNYDIISYLWPEGLGGVGFIDLDLDGTPEMILFDQGASATMGAHLFDLVDGVVYCVSSVLDTAAGAFGSEVFSNVSVCTNDFDLFHLSLTDDGYVFWIDSMNGSLESTWDEIICFRCMNDVLVPESVCTSYTACDLETGETTEESYTVDGLASTAAGYAEAASFYTDAELQSYTPTGVFLWDDISRYDITYDGLMAMAQDAAAMYQPVYFD